ncbi:hypothetical protein COV11_00635 [Candidatus Woesearchaeota archaeon CG10_big_fil_rev_8_21_14_0_10_30_7]|nr:MAG: hypothetical protein COV11_00635 [Candidatus Woesearchaeota archaeon CG10_big_fil_rev_8_21_14_0_10_30_7]
MNRLPVKVQEVLKNENIISLRPAQEKALNAGLLDRKNLLICTPTASGKTLVAEIAFNNNKKSIYIVPLIALASEKYKSFKKKYPHLKIALSIGDLDRADPYLSEYDVIVCTAEKLDSLLRHKVSWIHEVDCVIIDEIHLLNDVSRGPTLELLITLLKRLKIQLIGLSATIGNSKELAEWLNAELIIDTWRPVTLHKGVYYDGLIEYVEEN